jgi:rhamnulokinase
MADSSKAYLGIDLGASSGRVVAGSFDGRTLTIDDVYRFDNGGIYLGNRLHWDVLNLWEQIQKGLRAAGERYARQLVSLGVDTWGVDFALLGRGDELLGNPYHYRDRRTSGMMERAFQQVSREDIFADTGLQFMEINTLYQLCAMRQSGSPLLEMAESFLMMPDFFHWLLTGEKVNEQSNATTTQFYNPRTQRWATGLLERLQLPTGMLNEVVSPGIRLATLLPSVSDATGVTGVDVVLPGTHDTASAVMAVPTSSDPGPRPDWCYISSGTWSLMGVEVPEPVIDQTCRELNFTNEGGIGGTTRLLKNIAGLWLVQECRRIWQESGREYTWDELVDLAAGAAPLVSLIDPDHPDFLAPANMPAAIAEYCRRTGQAVPAGEGAMVRCVLESLALRYRLVLTWLEQLTGGRMETVHIVGGGSKNPLLSQMAADACHRTVVAGPVEATAIGNVMMHSVTAGDVGSIREARQVIRASFDVQQYEPHEPQAWDEAFERFEKLVSASP